MLSCICKVSLFLPFGFSAHNPVVCSMFITAHRTCRLPEAIPSAGTRRSPAFPPRQIRLVFLQKAKYMSLVRSPQRHSQAIRNNEDLARTVPSKQECWSKGGISTRFWNGSGGEQGAWTALEQSGRGHEPFEGVGTVQAGLGGGC
jgi:hypothetical protein